jgi:hypothetical protein
VSPNVVQIYAKGRWRSEYFPCLGDYTMYQRRTARTSYRSPIMSPRQFEPAHVHAADTASDERLLGRSHRLSVN